VDKTGLGLYSFALDWLPDGARPRDDIPLSGPSIYAVIEEQLGLHLQAAIEQFEILVVDSAESVPESN
jgi:uncharacterized protein (TIGR03435 family)